MSDEEHQFESKADAGASKTYPQQAGTIRKNGYIVIKARPCKVFLYSFFFSNNTFLGFEKSSGLYVFLQILDGFLYFEWFSFGFIALFVLLIILIPGCGANSFFCFSVLVQKNHMVILADNDWLELMLILMLLKDFSCGFACRVTYWWTSEWFGKL